MLLVDLLFTSPGHQRGKEVSGKQEKDFNLRRNIKRSHDVSEEDSVIKITTINLNTLTVCCGKYKDNSKLNLTVLPNYK